MRLAHRADPLERLVARQLFLLERLVLPDDPAHLLLDGLELALRDLGALGEQEVVVEAVVDRRPEAQQSARMQLLHRLRHHVRQRMS